MKSFFPSLLPNFKDLENRVSLSRFSRRTLGIDGTAWLSEILREDRDNIWCLSTAPRYPPNELYISFLERHEIFLALGIKVIYVFDGILHQRKRAARSKQIASARDVVDSYKTKAHEGPLDLVQREDVFKRGLEPLVFPDEEVVSFVIEGAKQLFGDKIQFMSAPFEAKEQLLALQQDGIISHICCCSNTDYIFAGGDNLLFDVTFSQRRKNGSAFLFRRDTHLDSGKHKLSKVNLTAAAAIVGCGYSTGLKGVGWETAVTTIMPALAASETNGVDWKESIASLKDKYAYDGGDFMGDFFKAILLFTHMPVLRRDRDDPTRLNLVPLKPFQTPTNENMWGAMMGLGEAPSSLVKVAPENYMRASAFDGYSFINSEGNALNPFPRPLYLRSENPNVGPTTLLPMFARVDFEALPTQFLPTDILVRNAIAKGLDASSMDRDVMIEALRVLPKNTSIVTPNEMPEEIMCWQESDEVLEPLENEYWRKDYFRLLPQLGTLNDHDIDFYYPKGDEPVRSHAMSLAKSGNVLVSDTMVVRLFVGPDGKRKLVVKCECLASEEERADNDDVDDIHCSYLCFEFGENMPRIRRRSLSYPYSRCSCRDGQYNMCSHQLALMMICSYAQGCAAKGETQELFESLLSPRRVPARRIVPMRIENLARR